MQKLLAVVAVGMIGIGVGVHFELSKVSAADPAAIATTTLEVATTSDATQPVAAVPSTDETTTPIVVEKKEEAKPAAAHSAAAPAPASAPAPQKQSALGTAEQYPVRLIIPSINLDVPIVAVGTNAKGEMDVPSGSSNNIGWYKDGPMPGSYGSAVLDAHVFAALKNLRDVQLGAPIYVETKGGTRLRFIVKESTIYSLSELKPATLFSRGGGQWLNIITCAGTYVPSINTYDHRLIDFALFDSEEL